MEKEIREILDKKLVGNDINIIDTIFSYLKKKCFICWNSYLPDILVKSYADSKPYTQLYMDVCPKCVDKFHFKRCGSCHIYVDCQKSYIVGNLDNVCCQYCIAREDSYGISAYTGWI